MLEVKVAYLGADALEKNLRAVPEILSLSAYYAKINSGERAIDAVYGDLRQNLNRPTPFIFKSLRLHDGLGFPIGKKARTDDVVVGFWDAYTNKRFYDPISSVMGAQVEGDDKQHTPAETRLIESGVLGENEYLMPSRTAKRNKYGNISPGEYVRMLSDLRTFNTAGADQNSKYKKGRGHYIVLQIGSMRGIFKTRGSGYTESGVRNAQLVWVIVKKKPRYNRRVPFYETVNRVVDKEYPRQFDKVLRKQLKKLR